MSTNQSITIALSKGRILDEALPLLALAGIGLLESPSESRKLVIETTRPDVRLLIVRATDVPTYVQYGGADMGITGKDTLLEHGSEGFYEVLALNIAQCRLSVAVHEKFDYEAAAQQGARIMVATKYPKVSKEYFSNRGMHVDLIKLYGSMELAPIMGMADAIVDLVSTGGTLKANHLREVVKIEDISSRLIVNQTSLKLKRSLIAPLITSFSKASTEIN